jgi:hypothetical protein
MKSHMGIKEPIEIKQAQKSKITEVTRANIESH